MPNNPPYIFGSFHYHFYRYQYENLKSWPANSIEPGQTAQMWPETILLDEFSKVIFKIWGIMQDFKKFSERNAPFIKLYDYIIKKTIV